MQWRWMEVWRNLIPPFSPPMLEWGIFAIPWIFCCNRMCWKMSRPLTFSSPLLSDFFTLLNEVNTWKVVSPMLPTLVLVFWSFEGTNLLYLVICFVILGSLIFGYSCRTSKICLLDVFVGCILGDGPPFDFAILCPGSFDAPFWHCLL